MKIPDCYIEDLNRIIDKLYKYEGEDIFFAYRKLLNIRDQFRFYEVPITDINYDHLLEAQIHLEDRITFRLSNYDFLEKRIAFYEGKS